MPMPLQNIDGRQLVYIKAVVFILGLLPLIRLTWLGFQDELSANPIEFIEHSTGTWALIFLMVTLSFTPLRLISGVSWPLRLRRMTGLFMFFYACLHFVTYLWLDHWFDWNEITKDIIEHPYVLVGFTAFMLTLPLALTSNNPMQRRLGRHWRRLHKSVYLIAILGVVHFLWLVKKDIREPLIYACVLGILFLVRVYFSLRKSVRGRQEEIG